MCNRGKVIKGWERCQKCEMSPLGSEEGKSAYLNCEYTVGLYCNRDKLIAETLALLKEQDKRYAMMVVDWLRDMAHNNYLDSSHMTFGDAILDIRERAQTGIENYFRDYDSDTK